MRTIPSNAGFTAHVGPIVHEDCLASTLQLQPHHLNYIGRFHGGMLMTLAVAALGRVAGEAAVAATPDARVDMLSLDMQFTSAAQAGAGVRAEVDLTRITRTMVFLTARLSAGEDCLAAVGAVYRIIRPGFGGGGRADARLRALGRCYAATGSDGLDGSGMTRTLCQEHGTCL